MPTPSTAWNHGLAPLTREIAGVPAQAFRAHGADTWLMSPPCQPFCRMGKGAGLDDRRSSAFLHLLDVLQDAPPERLALENVPGFLGSAAHRLLELRLRALGFRIQVHQLCPTSFGIPNQRPRAFLLASRRPLPAREAPDLAPGPLAPYLDAQEDPALYLDPATLGRHLPGLDLVNADSRRSACFIGGYGQRYVGSGSFLRTPLGSAFLPGGGGAPPGPAAGVPVPGRAWGWSSATAAGQQPEPAGGDLGGWMGCWGPELRGCLGRPTTPTGRLDVWNPGIPGSPPWKSSRQGTWLPRVAVNFLAWLGSNRSRRWAMKSLIGLLSLAAILGALPAAAGDDPDPLMISDQDMQPSEPSEPPPARGRTALGRGAARTVRRAACPGH